MSSQHVEFTARVHDIIRVDPNALRSASAERPPWVSGALSRAPHAVVRRGTSLHGMLPIGIRGTERSQRWAALCFFEGISSIYRPEDLLHLRPEDEQRLEVPAFQTLILLRERWERFALDWGPIGSVGFELATGCLSAKPSSDLDLVLRADKPLRISFAATLLAQTHGLPAALDIRVETPFCGFSLCEYLREGSRSILLRYPSRAIIGDDPWRELPGNVER